MDCGLNAADNGGVQCFEIEGRPDQYLFDPDLVVDKLLTSIEIKEVKREKADIENTTKMTLKLLGEKAPAVSDKEIVSVSELRRAPGMPFEEFLLYPKKGSGGMVFNIYERLDDRLEKPIGELQKNPATDDFKGQSPVWK